MDQRVDNERRSDSAPGRDVTPSRAGKPNSGNRRSVSRKKVNSAILPPESSTTWSAQGSYPPCGLGLYCPNAGEPLADPAAMTREPWQAIPGPNHQARTSSRPVSQRSYGGID